MPRCELPVAFSPMPVLPDQLARLGVQRLHDIGGIVDEHHPVVHHRSGLIGAVRHRPHPLQLQILHVRRVDLVQSAVIVGVIIVTQHQPVAGIGILHHRVGEGRVILHRSRDGQPSGVAAAPRRRLAHRPQRSPRSAAPRLLCLAPRPRPPPPPAPLVQPSGRWPQCESPRPSTRSAPELPGLAPLYCRM